MCRALLQYIARGALSGSPTPIPACWLLSVEDGGEQAYGHGGVGMVITALTDNVNRAIAEVKTVWRKQGLKQAAQGSVLFQFEKKGRVEVQGEVDEEQVSALGERIFLRATRTGRAWFISKLCRTGTGAVEAVETVEVPGCGSVEEELVISVVWSMPCKMGGGLLSSSGAAVVTIRFSGTGGEGRRHGIAKPHTVSPVEFAPRGGK